MAAPIPPLRLVTSDELGQLKVLQAPDAARLDALSVVSRWGTADRTQSAECIAVGSAGGLDDTSTAALAVGRVDGGIELLDPATGALRWRVPGGAQAGKGAAVRGLHLVYSGPAAAAGGEAPLVLSCTQGGAARLHAADADGGAEELRSWAVAADVFCSAFDPGSGLLAVGAQGTELRVFDASTGQASFVAKGGRPNAVGLPDRPWNSAAEFYPGSNGVKVWVGTGYRKLRLYDAKAGKRPQLDLEFGEGRVTALAPEADGLRCWVANGMGRVEAYDVRAGRFCGAIKGIAGSVRSLALHPTQPLLASVGLDRFLRVHETATRRPVGKVFLKTQMTGVAFCPTDASMAAPAAAGKAAAEEEVEEMNGDAGRSGTAARSTEAAGKRSGEARQGGGKKRRPRGA